MDFAGLKISLASPEKILSWSHGEVTKPETINYRTYKPEKDGLFDERIFGPSRDYECYCGKYKGIKYKGIICDRCGVEVTTSTVRRERMGHIKLAAPVAHIWYFKGTASHLSLLLDIPSQALERIIYFALYLVVEVDKEKKEKTVEELKKLKEQEVEQIEREHKKLKKEYEEKLAAEKKKLEKKIKNKEQLHIALREIEYEMRKKLKLASDEYISRKSERIAFFDNLMKVVKSLKPLSTLEEEYYLYLKEKNLMNFAKVGMGAEVIHDILKSLDLKELYSEILKIHSKTRGEKRGKVAKRLRIVEALIKAGIRPEWMILTVLPVLPPDLRPIVQLPGGKFATSDLNDFYRRVINRNNRLKQLIELGAPEIILRNEKRMLQEAVDQLIDLTKARGRQSTARAGTKVLKSLSDNLRGKKGRFRQNLLGKRVDYSGRSTIIVGPELKLNQCGIPKEMALELFKPYLIHEVIVRGLAVNIKSAKAYIEERHPEVYDILEEVVKDRPVLLNRAPTLHKLSVLAFYPVLNDHFAIELHPAVCAGYNADFDGDAMGVFLPLSKNAIEEVKSRMFAYQNLLKPADGSPIVVPNKEMALGCYYLTSLDQRFSKKKEEELPVYFSQEEALVAYNLGKVKLREPIILGEKGKKKIKTTVGRIIFNEALPEELRFINKEVRAADLKEIVMKAMKTLKDEKKVGDLVDRLKAIGFWGATQAGGLSVSIFDCVIVPEKEKIVKETEKKENEIREKYYQGLLTEEEKRRYSNNLWIEATEKLADLTWKALDDENPVKMIIRSGGARASREQLKQLSAIKGLVVDPLGKIIEVPTKSNYREGLSMLEYVISARGARKGLTDSALKTADAGYLTRRLVDVAHDVIVREEDCGTEEGLVVEAKGERADKFFKRIKGRYLAKPVYKEGKKKILDKGTLLLDEEIELLKKNNVKKVVVRSPLYCSSPYGVCQKCFGIDLSNGKPVEIGTPVGVIAAQSIGEPGTQLTMRVRHFGGIVISDVTQGLPRVEELFEVRTPKVMSPIAEIDGKVIVEEDKEADVYRVKIVGTGSGSEEKVQEVIIPRTQKLKVKDGELITAGTSLSQGYLRVQDILSVKGLRPAQLYLLNEIQKVYESQGIEIHDKYFEVIIRKMSDKIIIEDEGDTSFIKGEVVSRVRFEEENKKVLAQGGKPASGRVSILGITRAAIFTDSWLSAASFQETTRVLSEAALKGKVDYLLGLKENVIIGRLIPVTKELIDKYYKRFLEKYAYYKPASETRQEEEGEKDKISSA